MDNFITTEVIRKVLAGEAVPGEEVAVSRGRSAPASRYRQMAQRGLALAALLFLAFCLFGLLVPAEWEELRVTGVRGEVWVTRGNERFLLSKKISAVRTSDAIEVGEYALLDLTYRDGTQLSFAGRAKAALDSPKAAPGKSVYLDRGTLTARVVKQPHGKPMIFDTPQAQATVLGTSLTLTASGRSTRLDVTEGRVNLSRQPDGASIQVSAGGYAIAGASSPGGILFSEGFEDENLAARGWYDNTFLSTASGGAIIGSSRAAEYRFLPGADTAISGGPIRRLFDETESVYLSYWVRYSANYVGSKSMTSTPEFLFMTNADHRWAGPSFNHLTAYIKQQDGMPFIALQDAENLNLAALGKDLTGMTENRAVAGGNGVLPQEQATSVNWYPIGGRLFRNVKEFRVGEDTFGTGRPYYSSTWQHVEVYLKMNTISGGVGQPDGVLRFWRDGKLLLDRNSVILRTGKHPQMKFNQFLIAPFMEQGSPVDQTLWIDEVVVGVEPPS